jgi:glycosyltransferase involved in cell wall biosynthesis
MQKGLVSVLFISMNHEKYVEQGALSVLNQSWSELEILFVDNNSADRTFEIADVVFRNSGFPYKGFKRKENYGISANLNFLLKEANGEFIAVLSGDDWWDNDNLMMKINYLNDHQQVGLVYGNGYKFFQYENRKHLFYDKMQKSGNLFSDLLKGNLFFAVSVISRREMLEQIGGYDEQMPMEDWDMYLRMAEQHEIGYLDNPTCYSRITGKNLSNNIEFMNAGYAQYFKKYKKYPEMRIARQNIKMAQAFQLAHYSPGIKSLLYILKNFQFKKGYIKQIIRCFSGMIGVRQKM